MTVPILKWKLNLIIFFDDLPSLETAKLKRSDCSIPKVETKPNNIFDDLPSLETVSKRGCYHLLIKLLVIYQLHMVFIF